ncbi:hypothetical protein DPMN_053536 [Dreissena polymorpha]|uniref:Uncharacterized protein n=1 Tax=Dreissena polymorpha TaxID=45954 RepID=A0A9D4CN87_DREPO|nr:hypothetical protein DPMN_053536 [Dreissena polymorpha]
MRPVNREELLSSQYSNMLEKFLFVHSILKWKCKGNESSFYTRPPECGMVVVRACSKRTLDVKSTGRTYLKPNSVF